MESKTRSYRFALKIINFVGSLSKDASSQIIARQLLKAATSIGANIIEAQASPSRRDFTPHARMPRACPGIDLARGHGTVWQGFVPRLRGKRAVPRACAGDSTNFFNHALKSANETIYWLELLRDANKAERQIVDILIEEAKGIANILASSILTLKGKRKF